MEKLIIQIIIGLFLIVVGILNIKGNISLMHSYHRKRIKEEDIKPFGEKVGIGTIIIGITIILAGLFTILNYANISNVILIIGFVIGFIFIFYAIVYQKKHYTIYSVVP